jgi:hypothetical protein
MIHVLVVGTEGGLAAGFASPRSSVEVLLARGAEEAVDRLARNRRIDAVLLVAGAQNAAIAAAIREDSLAPPPFFVAESAGEVKGARRLSSDLPEELLDLVAESIASD